MLVAEAQREVRTVYVGGFFGQLVSAAIWAASGWATLALSRRQGILILVLGGALIFPLTQLLLRLSGRPASLRAGHPMNELAMEIAFVVPLLLPLAGAAALAKPEWFYPACMTIVGAHYLPFSFLYGMRQFLVLGALLVAAGLGIGLYAPRFGTYGAFATAALLVVFAYLGRRAVAVD